MARNKQTARKTTERHGVARPFGLGMFAGGHYPTEAGNAGVQLLEVSSMPYQHIRIKIYQQPTNSHSRFFYDPIMMVDHQKIQSHCDKLTGLAYVSLPVQMWDEEVNKKALELIQSTPIEDEVDEYAVQVMPYDEIRLTFIAAESNKKPPAYRLPKQPAFYGQFPKNLHFYLHCDTKEVADTVAESFKSDPGYALQGLMLECTMFPTTSTGFRYSKSLPLNVKGLSDEPEVISIEDETKPEDKPGEKLQCVCGEAWMNRSLVKCEICCNWLHGTCVGLDQATEGDLVLGWSCPKCVLKKSEGEMPGLEAASPAKKVRLDKVADSGPGNLPNTEGKNLG